MDNLRKHIYRDLKTGRDVVHSIGTLVFDGNAKISKIINLKNDRGKEVTYVYICNKKNESCLWKRIVITDNNIIEMEYDWNETLGYDNNDV